MVRTLNYALCHADIENVEDMTVGLSYSQSKVVTGAYNVAILLSSVVLNVIQVSY